MIALFGVLGVPLVAAVLLALVPSYRVSARLNVLASLAAFAASLLMLGEAVPAARACEYGLINQVVADGTVLDEAEKLAARLLEKPRSAILATKKLMKSPVTDVAGRMAEEGAAFSAQLQTPELASIIANFFAARAKVA